MTLSNCAAAESSGKELIYIEPPETIELNTRPAGIDSVDIYNLDRERESERERSMYPPRRAPSSVG